MSYRFSNKGEKSSSQLLYEWIETHDIGFEFTIEDVTAEVSKSNASASCAFFEEKGVIETIGRKKCPRKYKNADGFYFTRVYRFVKRHEGRFHSKPNVTNRNRARKSLKYGPHKLFEFPMIGEPEPEQATPQTVEIRNMVDQLLDVAAFLEAVLKENERLRKLLNEKV